MAATIMVDELVSYPQQAKPGAERYFGQGKQSCHLTVDGDEGGLHIFAARIGLRRAWCQHPDNPQLIHYDLTPNKRALALRSGAVFAPAREQTHRRLARQAEQTLIMREPATASSSARLTEPESAPNPIKAEDSGPGMPFNGN